MNHYCTPPSVYGLGYPEQRQRQPPKMRRMSASGGVSRAPTGVPIGMALEHILRELYDGHPTPSRHMDGTDDLHVSLRDIVYTDSPIRVTPITLPHT